MLTRSELDRGRLGRGRGGTHGGEGHELQDAASAALLQAVHTLFHEPLHELCVGAGGPRAQDGGNEQEQVGYVEKRGKEKTPMRRAWEAARFWKKKEVPRVSPKRVHQKEKVLKKAEGEPEDSMGLGHRRAGAQGRWARGEEGNEAEDTRFGNRGGRPHPELGSVDLSC